MHPPTLIRETLNKSAFYGEPAQLCDAGINKIKVLAPLIFPQTFPHLFNQRFLSRNSVTLGSAREKNRPLEAGGRGD